MHWRGFKTPLFRQHRDAQYETNNLGHMCTYKQQPACRYMGTFINIYDTKMYNVSHQYQRIELANMNASCQQYQSNNKLSNMYKTIMMTRAPSSQTCTRRDDHNYQSIEISNFYDICYQYQNIELLNMSKCLIVVVISKIQEAQCLGDDLDATLQRTQRCTI